MSVPNNDSTEELKSTLITHLKTGDYDSIRKQVLKVLATSKLQEDGRIKLTDKILKEAQDNSATMSNAAKAKEILDRLAAAK